MQFDLTTWIISDTHFGHTNIIKYCGRSRNHNQLMLNAWNRLVQPQDIVLHLGDLAIWYGPTESKWHKVASELPGQKYMIRGNHDHRTKKDYAELGITIVEPFTDSYQLSRSDDPIRIYFSHEPDFPRTQEYDLNVHGHTHNNPTYNRPLTYVNVSVEVMRYRPMKLRTILLANKGMVISNLLRS